MEVIMATSTLLLGKEMAFQTISSTSSSIISRVTHLSDNHGSDCKQVFAQLDINFKLDIISEFIKINERGLMLNEITKRLVNYINKSILTIEEKMNVIEKMVKESNKKWFSRVFESNEFLMVFEELKTEVSILENRFSYLLKLK
jgi:hypothetical protein